MKWLLKKLTSRFNKDQVGQSIVLLAFAFIALAAFVGLVTDISVLFVRYSNLRRTIDAAAIAAAGQIREGTDYGTVALTAREFIQLHGLEPHRVWVETCETDIKNWREGKDQWEGNPHPEGSFPDPSAMGNTELCKWDNPRKLVRVRAQIESETFFLRLLGFDTITLEASSVSETAVLDVALVLDTSQSMSGATQLSHYDAIGYDIYGTQPTKPQFRASCQNDQFDGATDVGPFEEVQYYQPFGQTSTLSPPTINVDRSMYQWGPCCNDPGNGSIYQDIDGTWKIFVDYNGNGTRDGGEPLGVTSSVADNDYSDLICHPFRDVKDSARNFIKRLDYVRGDRVAIITFDTDADIKLPNTMPEWPEDDVMLTDETLALDVLNGQVGVNENAYEDIDGGGWGKCEAHHISTADWFYDQPGGYVAGAADNPVNDPIKLPYAYSAWAQCPDTNIGGGIRRANDALTNVATIRRDAVWVMIVLSDGEANRTDPVAEITEPSYGSYGFCPWDTFCIPEATWNATWTGFPYPYADPSVCPADTSGFNQPWCNDDNPDERHFCLRWSQNPDINGRPDPMNPNCGERGDYDADDFARDWSDFAGLIEVADGVPGNFIAIFTIGFGDDIVSSNTAAPLLRYVADAGDNGFIDNDMQQDLRDNGFRDFSVPGDQIGEPGPCEGVTDPEEWCGQYYYASDLSELEAVFEAIASRLFTRLSR